MILEMKNLIKKSILTIRSQLINLGHKYGQTTLKKKAITINLKMTITVNKVSNMIIKIISLVSKLSHYKINNFLIIKVTDNLKN